ncbi:MAG: TolC family protein [Bacteroidales bacterium]|nr:TolC family protein [Bacteroidales bacterium]MBD5281539.1 TolC family protein [Bacteroides sp.]MBD5360050.1 TolC family protein [Bacteroides sp.]
MKKIYIAIIALGATLSAAAQQSAPQDTILSLEQCIDLAVKNNAALRRADNSAAMAKETRREAFTKYFPQISASGIGFRSHNYVFQYNALDMLNIELVKHGVLAGVQALQPIFMGGQIVNGNQLAKVGEAVGELQRAQTEREVRLTTEQYYWKLATLQATRSTLQSVIATLDTLDRQIQVAVDAGVAMRNDLLKVQLKRNGYEADMVDLDNGIQLCRMVLSQYIGEDFDRPINISAPVPEAVPAYPLDLRVDPAAALDQTIDYQLLDAQVKAKKLEKRMEVGKNLPQVLGGAGWYYHNVLEQGHNFGALQLVVNIPISGWWGGSHAIKRKNLELENAKSEREDLGQMLQINMQNKWDELTAAHRKMELASEAIGQAEENLRLNRIYYEAGTSTITDLLEAEALARQAHDQYSAAYGDFRTATAAYLNATGR